MSDLILRSTSRARVARHSAKQALVRGARRTLDRLRRDEDGQDMIEYAGVVVVVAVLIGIVITFTQSTLGGQITDGISNLVNNIFSSGSAKG